MYGATKPLFVRVFIDVFKRFFRDVGPAGFSVTIPEREGSLLVDS